MENSNLALARHTETVICDKHGEFDRTYIIACGKQVGQTPCSKCEEEKAQGNELIKNEGAKLEKERRSRVCTFNFDQSIPLRFKACEFDTYKTLDVNGRQLNGPSAALKQCVGYANNFERLSEAGAGLILCGQVGTGKTHLAISTGKQLAREGRDCHYVNLADLIRDVRSSWNDRDVSEDAIYRRYFRYDLLIIDEIGIQNGTENERNIIFEIINGRYERVKSTIIISNLSENEIENMISIRSVDRIKDGGGGTLVFDWGSYRNRGTAA
jgi:DNA replication protein DnaC